MRDFLFCPFSRGLCFSFYPLSDILVKGKICREGFIASFLVGKRGKEGIGLQASCINISMLGEFRVLLGDKQVNASGTRANQIWGLMQYLVAFRHKKRTQEELMDAMWEEGTGDPAGALKNRVYRIRTAFAKAGAPFAKEVIRLVNVAYCWNNDLPCEVDTEQFEQYCSRAADTALPVDQRIALYCQAVELYRGDFLPAASFMSWVVPLSRHYHTLYFNAVQTLLDLYDQTKNYVEMYRVANRAVAIDQFEEMPHKYILISLFRLGKQAQALSYYNQISELFYREMGVGLSEEMRTLYQQISQTTQTARTDLDILREDMREDSEGVDGAYYCEYEIFKTVYRIEARSARRNGSSTYLGLLGLVGMDGAELSHDLLERGMDALHRCIVESLRCGDVFSRCSGSQYVLMLSPITFEDGQMVLTRIEKNFKQLYHSRKVRLIRNLQPLIPI